MVPQIKKILYATDLTTNSLYAFYFAADLAQKLDAKIVVLHCTGPIPKKTKERKITENIAEIKKRLQEFCLKVEPQIGSFGVDRVSEIIVREGYPVEEILDAADAKECDVIIMGTHGKGWLKQTFLGSVARSVLERSRKPVLIIPLPSEKTSAELGTGQKLYLFAHDF